MPTRKIGTVVDLDEGPWNQGLASKLNSIFYITISSVHAFDTTRNRDLIATVNAAIVGLTRSHSP